MVTDFERAVYKKTQEVPVGFVTTYKEIAREIGRPRAFRVVGNALNKNPTQIIVPCHRVILSDRGVGGYAKGHKAKVELLKSEGVPIENGKVVSERIYRFK